jgi:hypothetical protein
MKLTGTSSPTRLVISTIALATMAWLLLGLLVACSPANARPTAGTWSIDTTPDGPYLPEFGGVSCVSATFCVAAGEQIGNGSTPLIESWDGIEWSIMSTSGQGAMSRVSCLSSSFCMAVGESDSQTLAEVWNGMTWATLSTPNSSTEDQLDGVSCVSAQSCIAVGTSSYPAVTLIESWNGTDWTIVSTPSSGSFDDVSCVSTRFCAAVGSASATDGSGTDYSLVDIWDGIQWSIVNIPTKSASSELTGVSCQSPKLCTAVGAQQGSLSHTFVERWNGKRWTNMASPNSAAGDANSLSSVSCTSRNFCTAVGVQIDITTSDYEQTLIESWNGSHWKIVASPNNSTGDFLAGVACIKQREMCSATGVTAGTTGGHTLIESSE